MKTVRWADGALENLGNAGKIQSSVLNNHQVVIGSSIGIAVAPDDGTDPDQLLKNADLALYCAKNIGRGTHCFFEPEMGRDPARRDLERDLLNAIVDDQFELHYQPVLDIETRRRWAWRRSFDGATRCTD